MRMNVYSIFDSATGAYMRPFFLMADPQALRSFTELATDRKHDIGKHPEDYSLVRIGTFDDSKACLHPEVVQVLITALEAVSSSRIADPEKRRDLLNEIEEKKINGEDGRLGQ